MCHVCSVEEVLQALSAALEVNEHLRQQVEEKGNLVQSMTAQMQAYENRHTELQKRLRELEFQKTEESAAGKISQTVCHPLVLHDAIHRPAIGPVDSDHTFTIRRYISLCDAIAVSVLLACVSCVNMT